METAITDAKASIDVLRSEVTPELEVKEEASLMPVDAVALDERLEARGALRLIEVVIGALNEVTAAGAAAIKIPFLRSELTDEVAAMDALGLIEVVRALVASEMPRRLEATSICVERFAAPIFETPIAEANALIEV